MVDYICRRSDSLHVYQGSACTLCEIKENLQAEGIDLKEAPMQTQGATGTAERHDVLLSASHEIIRNDMKS